MQEAHYEMTKTGQAQANEKAYAYSLTERVTHTIHIQTGQTA